MSIQLIFPFILLTLLTTLGFVSLVVNIVRSIKTTLDQTYTESIQKTQDNHLQGIAILFFLLFLGWLLYAGVVIGKYLIYSIYHS